MPTAVKRRTVETILADSIKLAMDEAVRLILPEAAPMISMLMKASKKTVSNPTFNHMEEEPFPRSFTFSAAVAYNATTATVSTAVGAYFAVATSAAGDGGGVVVLVPRTSELLLITAEDDSGSLTLATRGRGGTTATAILAGDEGIILGTANREDSVAPEPISLKKVKKTFYVQLMRDAFEITHTATGTEQYHGNDRTYQQRVKLIKHKMDWEYALLLNGSGENYDIDSDAVGNMRFATGALGVIPNVIDCGNNLTRPMLWRALRQNGKYHFGNWLCAGSELFMEIVNGWAYDAIRPASPDLTKTYGVDLDALRTPNGVLNLAKEKILQGTVLEKYAFIFPMPIENHIRFRPFVGGGENKDTKLYTNIKKEDNPQVYKDEYLTQAGFQWHEVSKMLILKNVG